MTNLGFVCALPVSPVLDTKPETEDEPQTFDSHDAADALADPNTNDPDLPDASDSPDAHDVDAKDEPEI